MTGRCLFGFSGEKPFLLPDNEGVKMNTSPVRMDDLPLNRFHCRIAALTFGAHLTDGYVLGVIGYAIIQLTPAMQLTPFMAGMIGGSALLGLFLGSLVLGWISDHIGRQKIFTFSFLLITLASFLQFFATTPEHLIGLRILIGIGLGGDYSVGHTLLAEMLGWPCFTQVERFTLDALFITLEQRTEHGLRCCRVRLPAVIAVRQCGEVALPVPGMRQRMAAGKAEIIRKTVAAEMPAMQCLQLARAEQRRGATLIDGQTVAEKAQKLWQDYLRQRMQP